MAYIYDDWLLISGYILDVRQTAIQNWSLFYAFSSREFKTEVRSLIRCRKVVINFRVKVQIFFQITHAIINMINEFFF